MRELEIGDIIIPTINLHGSNGKSYAIWKEKEYQIKEKRFLIHGVAYAVVSEFQDNYWFTHNDMERNFTLKIKQYKITDFL
jgi:hypothetical protein